MAAINFPDPAGQTPVNTFSPTSTPSATANGLTYEWTNGSWSVTGSAGGGGGATPDLQAVTDNGNETTNDVLIGGKVGVGTDSPESKLSIYGSPDSTDNSLYVSDSSQFVKNPDFIAQIHSYGRNSEDVKNGSKGGLWVQAGYNGESDIVRFSSVGAAYIDVPRMVVKDKGNVGIGTDAPKNKLDITTSTQYQGVRLSKTDGTATATLVGLAPDNGDGCVTLYENGNKGVQLSAGTDANYIVNGNVGIGTDAPSAKLDVAGNIAATAISGSVVATDAEVEEGTSTTTVITPATLKLALEAMGTTPPNIINEGWPGTNTGMLGFGFQAEFKGTSSNTGHFDYSILSQKDGQTYHNSDLTQISDMMMRGLEQWTLNSQLIDGSDTMIPVGPGIQAGDFAASSYQILACPGTLKGKTLDLYLSYAKLSSSTSQEETVANLVGAEQTAVAARWNGTGSGQTLPPLTVTNTSIYNTGARNLWVIRKRYTNLPDCCAIKFTGPVGSSYSTSYPAVCYYEIY